jgi:hypothetical protein
MKELTMIHQATQTLFRVATIVQKSTDFFWSGVWWLHLRRWLLEIQMTKALEKSGEGSMEARSITERYRRLERSIRYWRPSPPPVQRALEASERAGVPLSDLQLLALNREVRQSGAVVKVRRDWWMLILAYAQLFLVLYGWTMLSALMVTSPTHWIAKIVDTCLITALYYFLWTGFSLYTTRPYAAVRRSALLVEEAARSELPHSATIHSMGVRIKTGTGFMS